MDPIDIIFLLLILVGIAIVVIARILMRKGIWDWRDESISFNSRRGIENPYELAGVGVSIFLAGVVMAVNHYFGLKAAGLTLSALGLGLLVFCYFWLKRVNREFDDDYNAAIVSLIYSGCAIALGLFLAWMA